MHSNTVSKSLLAVAAVLQISGAAPLPSVTEGDIEQAVGQGVSGFRNTLPIQSALPNNDWIEKNTDAINSALSGRSLKEPKIGTTSSGSSGGSSGSSDGKTSDGKATGLLGLAEPFAASWAGKNIGDQISGAFGFTSPDTTSSAAAEAATETTVSSNKERRKLNSGGSSSGNSFGSSALNLGKDFATGTALNAGSQIGGDYLANVFEGGAADPSTSDAASAKERRSDKSSSGSTSASSSGPSLEDYVLDDHKDFNLDDITGPGPILYDGGYVPNNVESAVATASTTEAAAASKQRRRIKSSSSSSSGSSSIGNSGSSSGGGLSKLGKQFATDTGMSGITQIGGDLFADKAESALAPASTTEAAAAQKQRRRVKSSGGGSSGGSSGSSSGSSSGEGMFNTGKQFATDTFMNGVTQVSGDYLANAAEGVMAPSSTTEAAAYRKRDAEDNEASPSDLENHMRIGSELTPDYDLAPEDSPSTPTSAHAEERRSAIGSIAKVGGNVLKDGASSFAGNWLADEAGSALGMDNSAQAATPTEAATQKRSQRSNVAGKFAMKTGKKAASKIFHDESKNKTDSFKDDVKDSFEDIKNKLKDFLSFDDDDDNNDDSDSKMLKRSVAGAMLDIAEQAVQKRSSIPIGEPMESPSALEQRAPQGLFSATKNVWKMLDNMPSDNSDSTDDSANDAANSGTPMDVNIGGMDVARRSAEFNS